MSILFKFSFIAFSNIVYTCTSTELTGVCSNGSDGSRLECCENFRAVGNSCEECWPGTHGVDCRDYCPPNFYGRLCSNKCGCEPCDKVTGCLNATACLPGKFGLNCAEDCPMGYYGLSCVEVCQCSLAECDKALGCLNIASELPTKKTIIYWIIPIIFATVVFILICTCRWCKRNRHAVDLSIYQPAIHGTGRDEYDQLVDIFKKVNSNIVDKRKFTETSVDSKTKETGTSDAEHENEIYLTPNMQAFNYEEPIKHEPT